jgi:hypothetical protein
MLTRNYDAQARIASGVNILLGIWLLISPWVFGYEAAGSAAIWNSVIVGALIAILAAGNCFSHHTRTGLNWINVLLALWAMISPLVFGYIENTSALGDNIFIAILITGFAICSDDAMIAAKKHPPPSAHAH